MSRRGQNEGSIYKRADGRWVAVLSLPLVNGKSKRKYFYGDTQKEVKELLIKALNEVRQGLPVATERQTVEQFLTKWLDDAEKVRLAPKTAWSYRQMLRLYILPDLGRIQLVKLTPQDIQTFINQRLASGLLPRTLQYCHAILRRALNQAMRWEIVPRNVATLVDAPKMRRKEQAFMTPEDAKLLFDVLRTDRLEALYTVAIALGLRKGEALGLRWKDVNFVEGTVTVQVALQHIRGRAGYFLKTVKTDSGNRQIALPAFALETLRRHHRRQAQERFEAGTAWENTLDLVFTTKLGKPLNERNITRSFHRYLEVAGLARMRFYDMRHTCGAMLIAQGVHPRVVMEILGHSQISITMNTYGHVIPKAKGEAADKLNDLLQ